MKKDIKMSAEVEMTNQSESLIKSIKEIQRVRTRDNSNASSDGGSSGRSDSNDRVA
jgi:hypothetical protein